MHSPVDLLGQHIESAVLLAFTRSIGAALTPDLESTEGSVDRRYYSAPDAGLAIITDLDGIIDTVFMYLTEHEDGSPYSGPLPRPLPPTAGYAEVHGLLGEPQFQRPQGTIRFLGPKGRLERYDLAGFSLHIEYALDSRTIILLTVMRAPAS